VLIGAARERFGAIDPSSPEGFEELLPRHIGRQVCHH